MVVADDRRGGTSKLEFEITIIDLPPMAVSYLSLIIVGSMLAVFIMIVTLVICKRTLKCKKKT